MARRGRAPTHAVRWQEVASPLFLAASYRPIAAAAAAVVVVAAVAGRLRRRTPRHGRCRVPGPHRRTERRARPRRRRGACPRGPGGSRRGASGAREGPGSVVWPGWVGERGGFGPLAAHAGRRGKPQREVNGTWIAQPTRAPSTQRARTSTRHCARNVARLGSFEKSRRSSPGPGPTCGRGNGRQARHRGAGQARGGRCGAGAAGKAQPTCTGTRSSSIGSRNGATEERRSLSS